MAEWDPEQHPRDKDGKFGTGTNLGPAKGLKAFVKKHAKDDPRKPFLTLRRSRKSPPTS